MLLASAILTAAVFAAVMFQVAPMIRKDWLGMVFNVYGPWVIVFMGLVWLHVFFIVGAISRWFRPEALGTRLRRAESEQEDQIRRLSEAVLKEQRA